MFQTAVKSRSAFDIRSGGSLQNAVEYCLENTDNLTDNVPVKIAFSRPAGDRNTSFDRTIVKDKQCSQTAHQDLNLINGLIHYPSIINQTITDVMTPLLPIAEKQVINATKA